jgi:predicted MPP superfamily phosphohydrolase
VRARISVFVAIVQSILLLVHLAIYGTWIYFWGSLNSSQTAELKIAFAFLSVSFVAATLMTHVYFNWPLRALYTISAVWLGLVNFFFLAACSCWIVYLVPLLFGIHLQRRPLAICFFGVGFLLGMYAVVNARNTRVREISVKLPNLPSAWRGRRAAVVSDLHLGHLNYRGFLRRIIAKLTRLEPDVVFIPGDLFDGTAIDFDPLVEPWEKLSPPFGIYFVTGNHEEFSSPTRYLAAVKRFGLRTLINEKVVLDGLQIVGVDYRDSTHPEHFRSVLRQIGFDRGAASVLLVHTPDRLAVSAEEGISLQLSGHTHRGQFFPFTLIVLRMCGKFAYGLNYLGNLAVYTSCGAGTWGPPMRLGSDPEIVLIHFK